MTEAEKERAAGKLYDWLELRPDQKGRFDEVVARNCDVHLETMSKKGVFISISIGEKSEHHGLAIWISAEKGRLRYHTEVRDDRRDHLTGRP